MNTTEVENYPGFTDGIMGPDLMLAMRAQAERFGAEIVTDDVVAVELTGEVKSVTDAEGNTYSARTVILAMGSGYRKLGLPAEEVYSGRGVSWCATCDGFFFRDKDIAVAGGGDSALEEATFHPLRQVGHAHPSTRRVARLQDHDRPRHGRPEDHRRLELGDHRPPRERVAGRHHPH